MHRLSLILLVLTAKFKGSHSYLPYPDYISTTKCEPSDDVCEFILLVEEHLTMTCLNKCGLAVPHEGKLYSSLDTNFSRPIDERVIQADGYSENPRLVLTFNHSIPGPAIHVYQGQTVRVTAVNKLLSEGTSVHWHGLHQKGTPHMDGTSFVSQCPILPGQSFEYEFGTGEQTGTHFYHAHSGAQRTEGLFGAFIIHPRVKAEDQVEHVMILNDWNHEFDSTTGYLKMRYGIYENGMKYVNPPSIEGAHFSTFKWQSGLVNGRGRFWHNATHHNQAPLEVFDVQPNSIARFRVISAGCIYPLRVSIDGHELTVISSDGEDFEPIVVESFILSPGERFDFTIRSSQTPGNYWVRAVSLQSGVNNRAEAVLHYVGVPLSTHYDADVRSNRQNCSQKECLVLNCPFKDFPENSGTRCVHLQELKGATIKSHDELGKSVESIFLNFGFPGQRFTPGAINGIQWKHPTVSAISQKEELESDCDEAGCSLDSICHCTNTMRLKYGQVYQLVLTNLGVYHKHHHPIHIHGHHFQIIKQGFSHMDTQRGINIRVNDDLYCEGNRELNFCNSVRWSNRSWYAELPDTAARPIKKDTVMIPDGGYTVIRFTADNPGMWMAHCHIEVHMLDGMALMFDEAPEKQLNLSSKFPSCRNYLPRSEKSKKEVSSGCQNVGVVLSYLVALQLAKNL